MAEYSEILRRARMALNAPTTETPSEGEGTTTAAPDAAALAAEEAQAQAEAHQRGQMARLKGEADGEVDGFLGRAAKRVKLGWDNLA